MKKNNKQGASIARPHIKEITENNVGARPVSTQKEKGITLIALIITIIVMLILVAVSIQVALNTGLFDSAGKATQKWKTEQDKEANMQITIGDKTYGSVEDYITGKDAPEPTDSKYFKFTYDEATKTASIDGIKDEYSPEFTYEHPDTYEHVTAYVPCYIKDQETKITNIVIPKTVEKDGIYYEVTKISSRAFSTYNSGCRWYLGESELKSVYIPGSVTSIEDLAFERCSSLTSIEIADGVTSIGNSAFERCSSLTSIEISDSVTNIGESAFSRCSSLTSIKIPGSVTSIGRYVFDRCSSLTNIQVDSNNTVYDSRENCNAIIETSTNKLIIGLQNTEIPASVTSIGSYAFYGCSGLTSIKIPASVTSIGTQAFCECDSLTSIEIPDGVTRIGMSTFYGCEGLTSIVIPVSVTSIDNIAFNGCSSLTNVYYTGSEEDWAKISIGSSNTPLTSATITYNYTGE